MFVDIQTGENITETLVSEGLATVRRDGRAPEVARLIELEDAAKAASKGKWGGNPSVSSWILFLLFFSSQHFC